MSEIQKFRPLQPGRRPLPPPPPPRDQDDWDKYVAPYHTPTPAWSWLGIFIVLGVGLFVSVLFYKVLVEMGLL